MIAGCSRLAKSYVKSSISLDDMPGVAGAAVSPASPLSLLHNSPFYSPVRDCVQAQLPGSPARPAPATISPTTLSSFSTFIPPAGQRTSPEGSSCGEAVGPGRESAKQDILHPDYLVINEGLH